MREPHRGIDVDPVHGDLRFERRLVEASFRAEAGVVHEQRQARFGGETRGDGVDLGQVRQVSRERLGGDLVLAGEFGRKLLQPVEAAGDQEQVIALSGKLAGE